MTLCLIPARGGSKRVPSKNLREVGGEPLVVRAIRCAAAAGLTPTVSTDCMHIAAVSSAAGAEVIMRPAALATDTAQLEPTILHAVRERTPQPERVVVLQPTSPLREAWHITEALRLLDVWYDSVVAVVQEPHFAFSGRVRSETVMGPAKDGPVGWRDVSPTHAWVPYYPANRPRTQDVAREGRAPGYDCGLVYATTVESLRKTLRRDGGKCAALLVDRWHAIDVDSERDLRFASALLEVM